MRSILYSIPWVGNLEALVGLLKPQGRMVTVAAASEGTKDERIEKAFFIVEPNKEQLTQIAGLLDEGELQCFVDAVVPSVNASDAYSGTIEHRRGREDGPLHR